MPQCYLSGVAPTSSWAKMWADFNWVGWFKPQIDLAAANGANAVKITISAFDLSEVRMTAGGGDPWPAKAVLYIRFKGVLDYCRSINLGVYVNLLPGGAQLWGTSDYAARLAAVLEIARWCETIPSSPVVAFDMCNEVQFDPAGTWQSGTTLNLSQVAADLASLRASIRRVSSIPCTASVYLSSPSDWAGPIMQAIAPSVDFHDGHPYYGIQDGTVHQFHALTDVAALVSATWFKGYFVIGEVGVNQAVAGADAAQFITTAGVLGRHPLCRGGVIFSLADYDTAGGPTDRWGISDENVQNSRYSLLSAFQTWSGGAGATQAATTAQTVLGVPSEGIGFFEYPQNSNFNTVWDNLVAQSRIHPTHLLWFCGDFSDFNNVLANAARIAPIWGANPRLNGNQGRPPVIPVLSISLWYGNGQFTFDTLQTGANDAQLAQLIKTWHDAGFPKMKIRLGYEDNYPTTPGGMGAGNGAYPSSWSTSPSVSDGNPAHAEAWRTGYAKGFRAAARAVKAAAAALSNCEIKTIWGQTFINYCFQDPRVSYPDNPEFTADGRGSLVDIHGPDNYSNVFYGPNVGQLHPGYENRPPFTYESSTGYVSDIPTWAANGTGRGNKWYHFDWISGASTMDDPHGGWSMGSGMYFALHCPMGPKPMMWPESATINSLEGNNGGLTAPDGSGNDLDFAAYFRSRIAWFQQHGGTFLTFDIWYYQSNPEYQSFGTAFPELQV